jgi:uncharacterized BrkB/YihY/UPF0761 family membrane protein
MHITGPLAILALAVLVWGGSNLFSSMENVFSIFFRTQGRGFLPQKLMAVGMVVILAVLLLLSLAATGWPWHRICDACDYQGRRQG